MLKSGLAKSTLFPEAPSDITCPRMIFRNQGKEGKRDCGIINREMDPPAHSHPHINPISHQQPDPGIPQIQRNPS
jgi:hypothetical protein